MTHTASRGRSARSALAVALPALILGALAGEAFATPVVLPTGGGVVAGAATIGKVTGSSLTIDQTSSKAIINWTTFSIGRGATVTFDNGSGITLNRVTGGQVSGIDGSLFATGGVFILNPNGVMVGKDGVVNTGGDFVASSLALSNQAFLSGGDLTFTAAAGGPVTNAGYIVSASGSLALIGPNVANAGEMSARQGDVGLAAGQVVVLHAQDADDGRLSVLVGGAGTSAENTGLIQSAEAELKTNGGDIYALAVNPGTGIEATGVSAKDGNVWLIATGGGVAATGLITAHHADGSGGLVETSGDSFDFDGLKVDAGEWLIDPVDLTVDSTAAATISSNLATTSVTLQTTASSASGPGNQSPGAGDITIAAPISWASANILTLDAYHSIHIDAAITASGPGQVVLTTNDGGTGGDYDFGLGPNGFAGSISFTGSPGFGQALTINGQAYTLLYSLTDSTTPTGNGPDDGTGDIAGIDNNTAAGGDAGFYALAVNVAGTGSASAPQFSSPLFGHTIYFTGTFAGLGHTVTDLTIGASGLAALVGYNNGTIRDVGLAGGSVAASGGVDVGALVALNGEGTSASATILNSYSSAAVSGAGIVGGLVATNSNGGSSAASIINSYATGPVSASGGDVGGLVGANIANGPSTGSANILDSYATGAVTVSGVAVDDAGGLVGVNEADSGVAAIVGSYATGAVSAAANANVGGLVGFNEGDVSLGGVASITNAYATGSVNGGAAAAVGGLVGAASSATASITDTFSTGQVTGGSGAYLGGLIGRAFIQGGGTVVDSASYWDVLTSGQTTDGSAGSTGLTTAQLQGALPTGFGSSVWGTGAGLYPYLISFYPTAPQAISGFAFSAPGAAAAGAQVAVYSSQPLLSAGSVSSGANGYFYEIVPAGTVTASTKVGEILTLSGASQASGMTYTDQPALTAGNVDDFDITSGMVALTTSEPSFSAVNADLGATLGSNSLIPAESPILSIRATNARGFTVDLTLGLAGLAVDSTQGITFTQPVTIAGAGQVLLTTNDGGSGGEYAFAQSGSLSFTGAPGSGQALTINGQAYSLIYSEADLLNINNNLGGFYALAAPLSLQGFVFTDAPIASFVSNPFSGVFTGLGNAISELQINQTIPTPQVLSQYSTNGAVGLFGVVGAGGVVRDLSVNAQVVAGDGMLAGALAGVVLGTVKNDSSSGLITVGGGVALAGGGTANAAVGGLVGAVEEGGSIINSSSSATVGGGDAFAGGLAGVASTGATVSGSHATGDVSVTAAVAGANGALAGGLLGVVDGYQFGGVNPTLVIVTNDYATGNVTGGAGSAVGGLVGYADQTQVSTSYATGNVTQTAPGIANFAWDFAGGFIGVTEGGVSISQSYASGAVTTVGGPSANYTFAGGFIGDLDYGSTIANSYALGAVSASGSVYSSVGGFAGLVQQGASITGVYATGAVSGAGVVAGLAGLVGDTGDANTGGSVSNSYWDEGTTGTTIGGYLLGTGTETNVVGIGGSTGLSPYAAATYANFDLTNTWYIIDGQTRPILRSEYSTDIVNAHQLQLIALNLGANYTLGANINASETSSTSGIWNPANGFSPIGEQFLAPFAGSLNGQGYTVSNLTVIDQTPVLQTSSAYDTYSYVGLFGVIGAGALVQNINLTNATVTGGDGMTAGILAGIVRGTVSNASSSGVVTDGDTVADGDSSRPVGYQYAVAFAGGLVGDAEFTGSILNSSSSATVTAGDGAIAGGLAGALLSGATVSSGSASGAVTVGDTTGSGATSVTSQAGGLAGAINGFQIGQVNPIEVTVTNSYATGNVSGGFNSAVGGFASEVGAAQVTGSYATGAASGGAGSFVGGFAADIFDAQVSNSYATGAVAALTPPAAGTSSFDYGDVVGGFVGVVGSGGVITASYSSGAVAAAEPVNPYSVAYVGGFAGFIDSTGSVTEAYSLGSAALVGPAPPSTLFAAVGGFAGGVAGNVSNFYATGATSSVTAGNVYVGGLAGLVESNGVNDAYWDEGTTGQTNAFGLNGGTAANLVGVGGSTGLNPYAASTYANFDLTNTWYIIDGETRPILRAEYSTTITDAHRLELMSLNPGADYTLANNIDASETTSIYGVWNPANGFVPVGSLVTPFTGTLNGQGHSVANLTIIDTTPAAQAYDQYAYPDGTVGLFGAVQGANAVVENIVLANATVTGGDGMDVGAVAGALIEGSLLNVSSSGVITTGSGVSPDSGLTAFASAGGLVGEAGPDGGASPGANIANSSSSATVIGGDDWSGGLVGHTTPGTSIADSWASGTVLTGATEGIQIAEAGGLVGSMYGAAVSASYATGDATGGSGSWVGGFTALAAAQITTSWSSGSATLSGSGGDVGGFAGYVDSGTITQSFSSGAVSASGGGSGSTTNVGGFAGYVDGAISQAYSTGSVTSAGPGDQVGGFAGEIDAGGSVDHVYAAGQISTPGTVGGLAGLLNGSLSNSYWDEGTTGQTTGYTGSGEASTVVGVGGSTGVSPYEAATYAGWDFSQTWSQPSPGEYPELLGVSHVLEIVGGDISSVYGQYLVYAYQVLGVQSAGVTYPTSIVEGPVGITNSTSGWINVGTYALDPSNLTAVDPAGPYRSIYVPGSLTITPAPVWVSLTGVVDKTYDGTTNATVTQSNLDVSGVISGDIVSAAAEGGAYASKDVGTGIQVTASGLELTGADSANYAVTNVNGSATGAVGEIDAKALVATLVGTVDKVYDGTTTATLTASNYDLTGWISGDTVSLNDPTAGTYATSQVGTGIAVTATGLALSGAQQNDYTVNSTATAPIGVITPAVTPGQVEIQVFTPTQLVTLGQPLTPVSPAGPTAAGGQSVNLGAYTVFPVTRGPTAANDASPVTSAGNGDLWTGSDLDPDQSCPADAPGCKKDTPSR